MSRQFVRRQVSRITNKIKLMRDRSANKIKLMRDRSLGKNVIHVLHIGKTGGTAVKTALKSVSSEIYVIQLHDHNFRLRNVPKGDTVVFFVRDPVSRFVSSFYSRRRQGQPRYYSRWSRGEETAFKTFDTPNQLALALSSTDKTLRDAAVNSMSSIQHVKSSFHYWFDSQEYFLSRLTDVMFIGFQETLELDFTFLKRILDLPDSLELPTDPIIAHRNPAGLDVRLDAEAVGNLQQWYASDYDFLELCRVQREEIINKLIGKSD